MSIEKVVNFEVFLGKIFTKIDVDNENIFFHCDDGSEYRMFHNDDWCESVTIDDIVGDIDDLLNNEILTATENSNSDFPKLDYEYDGECIPESFTWTFYNISTIKGHVTIKWYGTSNGYYSESVTVYQIK